MMSIPVSRRSFLIGSSALAAVALMAEFDATATPAAAVSMSATQLLDRRRAQITGSTALIAMSTASPPPSYKTAIDQRISVQSGAAEALLASMVTSSGATLPWTDLPVDAATVPDSYKRSDNLATHFGRLRQIAAAYATPGTTSYQSANVAAGVAEGLSILVKNHYSSSFTVYGNWWIWEIGIPRYVVDTLTLLNATTPVTIRDGALAAIRYYAPNPGRRGRSATGLVETGANLADKSLITALRGLLDENVADITAGRDALSGGATPSNSLFRYVTSGDGFYTDGSFVQHGKIPYAGTYGVVALAGVVQMLALLANSDWAVSDPQHTMIYDVVESAFAPYIVNGRVMDTVRGRAVSRRTEQDYVSGFGAMSQILLLSTFASAAVATRYRELLRGWSQRYTGPSWAGDPMFAVPNAIALLAEAEATGVNAAAPASQTLFHAANERLVHRRPLWSFTVNTSSTRIGRFEWGNKENGRGWYQGDGMTFLYLEADQGQFSNGFWPTVDSLALPGITATSAAQVSGVANGTGIPATTATYSGGVSFSDRGGTTGMQLVGYVSSGTPTLNGYKSWHAFDDGVVCVGSSITDTSGSQVVTVLENRGFAQGAIPTMTADGSSINPQIGGSALTFQKWTHVNGVGGYVMVSPTGAQSTPGRILTQRHSGTWADINPAMNADAESAATLTRDYVRLDVLHGANPANAQYTYLLLPGADQATTSSRAANPGIQVSIVNGVGHLVNHVASSTAFAHFFSGGTVGGASASARCAVGMTQRASAIEIAVSDPSHATTSTRITFSFGVAQVPTSTDVTVVSLNPLTVDVNLSGKKGKAVTFNATPDARMFVKDLDLEVRAVVGKLALDSGGRAAGSNVTLYTLVSHANLRWKAIDVGDGFYRFVNKGNGLALSSGGAVASGSSVKQEASSGSQTQHWRLIRSGLSMRYRIVNRANGLALDSGGSLISGSTVKMWNLVDSPNLEWEFRG